MIGMAKGMLTTLKHAFRPAFTTRYPWGPVTLPERSRTSFALPLGEDGLPLCKACNLCAKSCPDAAIVLESEKRADGPGRVLTSFKIDLGLCMYCGICVENCPSSGLHHTGDFETATHLRDDTMLVLFEAPGATAPAEDSAGKAPVAEEAS